MLKNTLRALGVLALAFQLSAQAPAVIQPSDSVRDSRATINSNFALLAARGPGIGAAGYNFQARAIPARSLAVGSNTVTLRPCPQGVNGADSGHQVYVAGGTGAAETVLIAGGTCVSGADSGTVVFSAAQAHSGDWSLASATGGGQEAVQVLQTAGTGGTVQYGQGVFANCGTISVTGDGITIAGEGSEGNGTTAFSPPVSAATVLEPCAANQTLVSVTNGYSESSSVAKLSMRDIGFRNNGLAGVTGIYTLRDTGGNFNNLSFLGTGSNFTGFSFDRCALTKISNVNTSGLVSNIVGSLSDSGAEWSFGQADIDHFNWMGNAVVVPDTAHPFLTLQRCITCRVTNSQFWDAGVHSTGIGIAILNNTQGTVIDNILTQGMLYGVLLNASTVGATTAAPGWNTISNAQLDGCNTIDGCAHIFIGGGVFETGVFNSTLTGFESGAGTGIKMNAGATNLRASGNLFAMTSPSSNITLVSGATGILLTGNVFDNNPAAQISLPAIGGTVNDVTMIANYILGSAPIVSAPLGSAIGGISNITGNNCPQQSDGECDGRYGPLTNKPSQALGYDFLVSLLPCTSNRFGATAVVSDSSTAVWGAAIAGGGSNQVGAFCNGTAWTVASK